MWFKTHDDLRKSWIPSDLPGSKTINFRVLFTIYVSQILSKQLNIFRENGPFSMTYIV